MSFELLVSRFDVIRFKERGTGKDVYVHKQQREGKENAYAKLKEKDNTGGCKHGPDDTGDVVCAPLRKVDAMCRMLWYGIELHIIGINLG